LELIEDGSMPPGAHPKVPETDIAVLREWVNAGAPAYPLQFDDEYAHATILADVQKFEPENTAAFRYLSLHHRAAKGDGKELTQARVELLASVTAVGKRGVSSIQAIDPAETVFRFDLHKAGWHHRPFKKLNAQGQDGGPADANLFDVVLLEYPHGVLPASSASFDRLGAAFLKSARQIRPIAFVRGDWFGAAVTTSPLADELAELLHPFEGDPLPPGLAKPKADRTPSPTEAADIPAIDSRYGVDPAGMATVKGFKVETIDADGKPRDRFSPKEKFRLRVVAEEAMYFQLVWIDSAGAIDTRTPVVAYDPRRGPHDIDLPIDGLGLGDELGKERLIVFAAPHSFAPAEAWRARLETKTIERFAHPFFALRPRGEDFVPERTDAKVMRRTVGIEIVKPAKK
jgi:hypothetical protein